MISNDYAAGDDTQSEPNRMDRWDSTATRQAGRNETGHPADFLHPEAEPPPEWKTVRLEPKVSQLLESMEDPVVAHDAGVIIGFNQRVPVLLGCPGEKILWRRLSKFIEPVSMPTLARWIEASDRYTILVNCVLPNGGCLLLRLEAVASLVYPGGRRVEVVALVEFAPAASPSQWHNSD